MGFYGPRLSRLKARTPSARHLRDELLVPEVSRRACGELRRLWASEDARSHAPAGLAGRPGPNRQAHEVAWSCRRSSAAGRAFTTRSDPATVKPGDLVNRQFTALAPRRLWVADVTASRHVERVRLCRVRH